MKQQLLEKIQDIFQSQADFNTIFLEKKSEVEKQKEKLTTISDLDTAPTYEDIESFYLNSYVDLVVYSQDLQILFFKFGNYCDLYKELYLEELPEEMKELYRAYKSVTKNTFVMKNGNLSEVEEGSLEERRQEFINGDTFQNIKKTFK